VRDSLSCPHLLPWTLRQGFLEEAMGDTAACSLVTNLLRHNLDRPDLEPVGDAVHVYGSMKGGWEGGRGGWRGVHVLSVCSGMLLYHGISRGEGKCVGGSEYGSDGYLQLEEYYGKPSTYHPSKLV